MGSLLHLLQSAMNRNDFQYISNTVISGEAIRFILAKNRPREALNAKQLFILLKSKLLNFSVDYFKIIITHFR